MTETGARDRIASVVKPISAVADLFVFRRTPIANGLKEVMFAIKIKRDALNGSAMADALMGLANAGDINFPEKIEFAESTLDFNDGLEHEYFMVKATLWTGG